MPSVRAVFTGLASLWQTGSMSPYPARFRERALAALAHGTSVVAVAVTLQIDQSTLYRWRQLAPGTAGPIRPPART